MKRRPRAPDLGGVLADWACSVLGSWWFVRILFTINVAEIFWNVVTPPAYRFDPFPFVFANLALSELAGYSASIVLISQNRIAGQDRATMNTILSEVRALRREVAELKENR